MHVSLSHSHMQIQATLTPTLTPRANLKSPENLSLTLCVADREKKLKYIENTHAHAGRVTQAPWIVPQGHRNILTHKWS